MPGPETSEDNKIHLETLDRKLRFRSNILYSHIIIIYRHFTDDFTNVLKFPASERTNKLTLMRITIIFAL